MPTISGITGAVTHGQSITITGTGFGTKAVAAPLVWDNASGPADMLDLWDVAWPNQSWNVARDEHLARRGVIRGIQPPHARTGRYMCGAHNLAGNGSHAAGGNNVMFWKSFTKIYPVNIYQSCWMRADPLWTFSGGANDDQFKEYIYAQVNSPTSSPLPSDSVTFQYASGTLMTSLSTTNIKHVSYGELASSVYGGVADVAHPMLGWNKYELLWEISDAGRLRAFENGRQVYGRTLAISAFPEPLQSITFGDYARMNTKPDNWRYYTDCYVDTTSQRVILGNSSTLNSSSTIREIQVPTAWADTSITVTVNRGVFADDDPVFVFVVDAVNVASDGFLIEGAPVQQPPVITSATSVFVTVNDTDPYQIVATNAPTSFGATTLPSGRAVNPSTGSITGTYDALGVTQTTVSATNAFGTDQEIVTFDVSQAAVAGIEEPVNIGAAANRSDTTEFVTVQQPVPAGNTVLVWVSCFGGTLSTGIPTCSDNVSFAQYERDMYQTNTDGSRKAALFRYSNNVELPAGSVITVSISDGVGDAKSITAWWVRGLNLIDPLDVFNSDPGTFSNTPNSGPITTT